MLSGAESAVTVTQLSYNEVLLVLYNRKSEKDGQRKQRLVV